MNNEIWAHYIITAVRKDNRGVITDVQIGEDSYSHNPIVITKPVSYVINFLNDITNKNKNIITVHKDKKGTYQQGAKVIVQSFRGNDYLKSSLNDSTLDNLDNLPTF